MKGFFFLNGATEKQGKIDRRITLILHLTLILHSGREMNARQTGYDNISLVFSFSTGTQNVAYSVPVKMGKLLTYKINCPNC